MNPKDWLVVGLKLFPLIASAVGAIEKFGAAKKGKEKQDAAVDMVGDLLPLIEGYVGKDLLQDAAMQALVRQAIDIIVAINNAVAAAKAVRVGG